MPSNLEIKTRIASITDAERIANSIGADFSCIIKQKDTYFKVDSGRLKLREFEDNTGELILYDRDETESRRFSDYNIYSSQSPESLKEILKKVHGILGVVVKERMLFLYGDVRIHLDQVVGLGSFLEFEIPVHNSPSDAKKKMIFLIDKFGIKDSDLIHNSYIDLLKKQESV
ncbi:MAG: class IV adenylate cyclase [Bacteroidota bacterium]